MASVQDLYSGIIKPGGGMFDGTGGAGVYDGILPGATGSASGELTTRSVKTVPIDPYTGQPRSPMFQPGMLGRATGALPTSQFMTATERALLERQIAQSKSLQAGYDANGRSIVKPQTTLAGMFGRGLPAPAANTAVASVPLPRVRPGLPAASGMPGPGLDDLLAYTKGLPDVPQNAALGAIDANTSNGGSSPIAALYGSSTGKAYAPGSLHTAGGYVYEASPSGFKKVGKDPNFVNRNNSETAGDRLVARATGATSSAENQAWRERTYGGSGGSLV